VLGVRPEHVLRNVKFDVAGHRVWSFAQYVAPLAAAGFVEASARRVPDPEGAGLLIARRG